MTDRALDDLARRVLLDVCGQEYGDAIEELPEHDFSPAFEKKMKKLIRRADHPIRYRVAQAAACILLAALLSGCTVLAISPEARNAFVGWVREIYDTYFVYRYYGETQALPEDVIYRPSWLPNGYQIISEDIGNQIYIIYENEDGEPALFAYTRASESFTLNIDRDGREISQRVFIGDISADLYIDQDEGENNVLIWTDEHKGLVFYISAQLDCDELIKIAESVEAQEIPKPQATYRPTWLPEGYSQSLVPDSEDLVNVLYASDAGSTILFAYSNSASSLHLFPQGETESFKVMVNDTPADFYLDNDSTKANWLVWEKPENDLIYWIAANLPMDDLIRIAESVQEVPEPQMVYQPTWVPDGYNRLKQSVSDDSVRIIYENNEGYLLSFIYARNRESVSVYTEYQETDVQTVMVGGKVADLYLDQREGKTNTLIWSDEEKRAIFVISAHCSGDELIKIAESVTVQEVPK